MYVRRLSALLVGLAVTATACSGGSGTSAQARHSSNPTVDVRLQQAGSGGWNDIPQLVKQHEPEVVTIFSTTAQGQAIGSGVIWSPDGVIVTDAHVVKGTQQLRVQFADGKQVPAKVIATDDFSDLAAIRVQRSNLPAATFASQLPDVGQLAVVIGTPLGLEESVTAGIVSALDRQLPPNQETPHGLFNLIQTDAPISPGNSGGGVYEASGQVMGISEAYISPQSGAVAIGFATPSTIVKDVIPQLLSQGHVRHAYVGLTPTTLTPQIQQALGLKQGTGVVVVDVAKGSPADQAGLQRGDVITQLGSATIQTQTDLMKALRQHKPGDTVQLTYVRNGDTKTTQVTLGSYPQQAGG